MDFARIAEALRYLEENLGEEVSLEDAARAAHFSPYYFHRVFSAIVGRPFAAYLRERRLYKACALLAGTDERVLAIALDCGFHSAQAFSRAFREFAGVAPVEYRRRGELPRVEEIGGMIDRFAKRLKGGIFVQPTVFWKDALAIAGVPGDGARTGEVWGEFMALIAQHPIENRVSDSGYEVRVYDGEACVVHVGYAITGEAAPPYRAMALPGAHYAAFDVYVAQGYDSGNSAMDEWLAANPDGWRQRMIDGKSVCVEYYDERFHGDEADSIVEIWIPIERG